MPEYLATVGLPEGKGVVGYVAVSIQQRWMLSETLCAFRALVETKVLWFFSDKEGVYSFQTQDVENVESIQSSVRRELHCAWTINM